MWKARSAGKKREKPESYWRIVGKQLKKNKGAMFGLFIVIALILVAVFAPLIAPYDPVAVSRDAMQGPSLTHLAGTDVYGRDVLSRVIHGSRFSLWIGVISVSIGLVVGVSVGVVGGYFGGKIDAAIVMLTDAMLAFPSILLALAVIAVLGPGLRNVMIAVGISSIPRYARLARSTTLSLREELYVEGARAIGAGSIRIMLRHIVPNIIGPIVVLATLSLPTAILTAAGLSYLGLGAQPPIPEWGLLVSDGRKYLRHAWWISTFPGVAIMITVLSINLLGDGLRDANDPRLRKG